MLSNFKLPTAALLATLAASSSWAVDGTWTLDGDDTWDTTNLAPWSSGAGPVAEGADFTAFFDTIDITVNRTVTLTNPLTIGNMTFADTVGSQTWTLSGSTLTLDTTAGTPTITNTTQVTINSVLAGNDGLTKAGAGLLVLTGANTYSGNTTISAGSLRAQNNSAFGSGEVTVVNGARLQLQNVNLSNTININGSNALFRSGGSSTLSGTVNLQSDSALTTTTSNNGSTTLSGTLNLAGHILTVSTQNLTPSTTISGIINGTGGIAKNNDGTLRITNDNSATYSGTTTINRGIVELGHDGALGSGTLALNTNNDTAGTIRSSSGDDRTIANVVTIGNGNANARYIFGSSTTGNLTFTNATAIDLGSTQRRFGVSNAVTQFDAGFTGSGGITKENAGTLVLNGTNTYTGNTTVSAGTLDLNGLLTFIIGTDGVNNQINGTATALLDGIFDFNLNSAGTTLGDSWLIVDVASLDETFGAGFSVNGFTDAGGNLWTKNVSGVVYEFNEGTGTLSVIPEPATLALMGLGGLLMAGRQRRK